MRTHWMDVNHWIYTKLSGDFIVLRSLGAGKHALNSLMLKVVFFLCLSITLLLQGGSQCMWVSSVSCTKKMNSTVSAFLTPCVKL